jgi:hypothetical protein
VYLPAAEEEEDDDDDDGDDNDANEMDARAAYAFGRTARGWRTVDADSIGDTGELYDTYPFSGDTPGVTIGVERSEPVSSPMSTGKVGNA